ncbi:MAG: Nif3-like dinuclear metal center hexameric protein [Firmicutes bacterium]|nr:Nif3-like dinuclear metal center hexameric protein [Bacillota bacterium]
MKSTELYKKLESFFDLETPEDDWEFKNTKFLTPKFSAKKNKDMGLMCDNTNEITRVFTVTFLNSEIIEFLKIRNIKNALVFCHHPMCWDLGYLKNGGEKFKELSDPEYQFLKDNKISVFVAHHPLDNNNSEINVNKSLANAIGLEIVENHICDYDGISLGVVCRATNLTSLKNKFESAIGHKSHLLDFGCGEIKNGLVAIVGGGGNKKGIYEKLVSKGINTYITGIVNNETGHPASAEAIEFAKDNKINILAGTHYSTEKFALIDMVGWFQKLGVPAEFIPQQPKFSDYTYGIIT